jgi:hypothetical protein
MGHSKKDANQVRVGYQFYENPCDADESLCDSDRVVMVAEDGFEEKSEKVLEKFLQEMDRQKVGNVEVEQQFAWPYFHHFPQGSIENVWKLYDMQGERKTWWIGASASFESVHDVINYNLQLLDSVGLGDGENRIGGLKGLRGAE